VAAIVLIMQRLQASRQELREQASRITWWLDAVPDEDKREGVRRFADGAEFFIGDYGDLRRAALFICNDSGNCVYEASLKLSDLFARQVGEKFRQILWRQLGVILPGTAEYRVPVPFDPTPTASARSRSDIPFNLLVDWVEFRDRNNKLWRRFGDGRLEQQADRRAVTEAMRAP
jgi:hypothetical protein